MLNSRRSVVGLLWVTVVAAVGLVLGLLVAPAATASDVGAGSGASSSAADVSAGSAGGALGSGSEAVDPVTYINAQETGTVAQISNGRDHTCAVTSSGFAYCWGSNQHGKLGDGQIETYSPVPVRVVGVAGSGVLSGVQQISAGTQHTCALTGEADGNAYCWGLGHGGRLGVDATANSHSEPRAVTGPDNGRPLTYSQITTGKRHTCAISGGSAYCWGRPKSGQLGTDDKDTINVDRQSYPLKVSDSGGFTNGSVTDISAGLDHTCAVSAVAGGRAFCWGNNGSGRLGIGTAKGPNTCPEAESCSLVPVQVVTGEQKDPSTFLSGVRQIAAGIQGHTCALTGEADGNAYCWGLGDSGRLGDGPPVDSHASPRAVTGPDNGRPLTYSQITTGRKHTCAVAGDPGTAFCWGSPKLGQLGAGKKVTNNANQHYPLKVSDSDWFTNGSVTDISAGFEHTCAVSTADGGQAFCWGASEYGQLGVGTTDGPDKCSGTASCSQVPVPVAGGLQVTPPDVDFGSVKVGASASKEVTVQHSFPLTVEPVVVDIEEDQGNRSDFSFTAKGQCANSRDTLTLLDGQGCKGSVKFAPTAPGEFGEVVSLTPREFPSARTEFAASGFARPGANPGGAVVKASYGDLGKVAVFTAKYKDIKIKNVGDEPLKISGFTIKDDAEDEFDAGMKDCTKARVAPGKSCTAKVEFFPRVAGESVALLKLKSNAIGVATITLSGEGVIPDQALDANGNPVGPSKVRKLQVSDQTLMAKKATAQWKHPKGDVTVTSYQTRIQETSGNWKKWSEKDPKPNLNGWISRGYTKLSPNTKYKVQVRAVSYEVRGKKSTVGFTTDRRGIPTRPANG